MAITADNYSQYLANYKPTTDYAPSASTAAVRKPGNWATHLLPVAGSILGGIIGGGGTGGFGGVAGAAGGGSIGKALENHFEHQSLGSGVVGQGLLGGASEGVGELAAPVISKAISPVTGLIGRLLGQGGTEAAVNAGTEAAAQGAGDAVANGATSASDLVPGSKSGFLDSLLSRFKAPSAPVVSEGTGAVEVGQGGKLIDLSGKATPEVSSAGITQGHSLATAPSDYTDAVKRVYASKGINIPDNFMYNAGAKMANGPRELEQALGANLKTPDMAKAAGMILDTSGHGGSVLDQFNEVPAIHQTFNQDLKGTLEANTKLGDANSLIDKFNKIPEQNFQVKPIDDLPLGQKTAEYAARAEPDSEAAQIDKGLQKAGNIVKKYATTDGEITAKGLLNATQEIGDLIPSAQWKALTKGGDAAVSTEQRALYHAWQSARGEVASIAPEASDLLKTEELTGHHLMKALQGGIADSPAPRIGMTGRLRTLPGVQSAFQSAQSGVGRALQGLGGATPQLAETAQAVVPQILGHNIGSSVSNEQEQEKNAEAAAAAPDLSAPSSDIQDTLKGVNQPNALGIDPEKIKQAELADLVTTGGKNLTALSKIESVVNATQGPTLSAGGTQATADYQNSVQALQGLNGVFNSNASTQEVQQAIAQALPYLLKATGLAKKDLLAQLPSATADQATVNDSLAQIKALIDQKANQTLQTDVTKTSPDSTSSLISSLLGQGA